MKLIKTLLTTTILSAVALTASAGKSAFEGTYVGAQLGTSKASSTKKYSANISGTGAPALTYNAKSSNKWGVNGGLTVGHRAAVAQDVILGVSLGVDLESTKAKSSGSLNVPGFESGNVHSEVKRKYIVNLLGQAGYTVTKDFMPYITAGLSVTQFSLSTTNPNTQYNASKKKTKLGYAVGVGSAYAINEMVSADLQYLYTGYGKVSASNSKTTTGVTFSNSISAPKAYHTVTVGVKVNI